MLVFVGVYSAAQRKNDRTTTIRGEAASCRCGFVSIDKLEIIALPPERHWKQLELHAGDTGA
jgi:hypothetical protein